MNKIFEYYADIIPEKASWHAVCSQPLPTCFWTNTLKISSDALRSSLEKENYQLVPLSWQATAFRSSANKLGKRWQYLTGLLQIQEEVSMLPVHFLNPQVGERILDLCAAPGNKTAQVAVQLHNTGTVIANDKNFQRMRAFGQISKRLGLMNVSTTIYDGRHYPALLNYFDAVLVDAPCSGEGTFRKGFGKDLFPNPKNSQRLQRIQIALLKKAIRLCRSGGRIVYATCTFAPEENEAVIDAIIKAHDDISLRPIHLDQFKLTPGITRWRETIYDDAIKNTARVWPHLNNTGGFFIAVLEKNGADKAPPITTHVPGSSENIQLQLQAVSEHFAIPKKIFEAYRYSDDNCRGIYLMNTDNLPSDKLSVDATGLFF